MGLDGLGKKANTTAINGSAVDDFIRAAKVTDGPLAKPASEAVFKRLTFSLDAEIDKEINYLSLIPRSFRATRSDVVRAAIALLRAQSDSEIADLLKKAAS